jgi:hypothetical protein
MCDRPTPGYTGFGFFGKFGESSKNSIGACQPEIGAVCKMTFQVGMEIFDAIAATEKNRFERVENIFPGILALGSNAGQMCMAKFIDF